MESFCCFEEIENNFYNEFDEKSCLFFPWLPATVRLASKESKQDEREIMKKSYFSYFEIKIFRNLTFLHDYRVIEDCKCFRNRFFFTIFSISIACEVFLNYAVLMKCCHATVDYLLKFPESFFVITRNFFAIFRNLKASVFL